jgi:hypothetical protein
MSRVRPSGLVTFPASASNDVTGYRMYYRQVGQPNPGDPFANPPIPPAESDDGFLSYNDARVDGLQASQDADGNAVVVADLSQLQLGQVDGQLRVGLSAIDDAGNESDIGPTTEVPFDDVAPEAPGAGVFSPAP